MRLTIGVSFAHPAGQQLCLRFIEVLRQFYDDGVLTRWRELQPCQPPSDLWFPVRHVCFSFSALLLDASAAHSQRNATSGSTFVARRAGTKQASKATAMSSSAIAANVAGSVALTLKSRFFIVRVNANDETRPSAKPINVSFMPCLTTSFNTSRCDAPSAIRTPISRVRCATAYDINP